MPFDFILFFNFIAVCGPRSQYIFFPYDCEKKFIGPVLFVHPSYRLNVDYLLWEVGELIFKINYDTSNYCFDFQYDAVTANFCRLYLQVIWMLNSSIRINTAH